MAAVALSAAAGATAAPPWTPPQAIPGATGAAGLVLGSGGRGLLWTSWEDHTFRALAPDGSLGPRRRVPDAVGLSTSGNEGVLLRRSANYRRVGVSPVNLSSGRVGRQTPVYRGPSADAQLAVGARGRLLVGVDRRVARSGAGVRLHWTTGGTRGRWRSFALPGRAVLLDASVDGRDSAVLLLHRGGRILARTFALRTGRLGPERTLDTHVHQWLFGSVSTNGRGDAVLAWSSQDAGEEADTPYIVRATTRRRGTTRFTPTATLDPGGTAERPDMGDGPSTAIDDAGNATVAWNQSTAPPTGFPSVRAVPRAAVTLGPGRFGPHQDLFPSGHVVDVASSGMTTLVSAYGSTVPPEAIDPDADVLPSPVAGIFPRAGGGPLGAPESVTTGGPGDTAAPELSATADGYVAVWTNRVADRNVVQRATRPAR